MERQQNLLKAENKNDLPDTNWLPTYTQFTELGRVLLQLGIITKQEVNSNAIKKAEQFYEQNREIFIFD